MYLHKRGLLQGYNNSTHLQEKRFYDLVFIILNYLQMAFFEKVSIEINLYH